MPASLQTRHTTILLAEDDMNDVFLVQRALEKAGLGHMLMHVQDGQQCINYLRGDSPYHDRSKFALPNLLLLDLKMPVMSGLEVLTWISQQPHLKALPVIILTGSLLYRDWEDAVARGATGFHIKPVQFDDLVVVVKALDARWLALQ